MKHLYWLDQHPDADVDSSVQRNLYLQLAAAYYVNGDSKESGLFMHKAMEIDNNVLFNVSNMRYLLAMYMPLGILNRFRQFKRWILEITNGVSTNK